MKFDKNVKPEKWEIADIESPSRAVQLIQGYCALYRVDAGRLDLTVRVQLPADIAKTSYKVHDVHHTHFTIEGYTKEQKLVPQYPFTLIIEP